MFSYILAISVETCQLFLFLLGLSYSYTKPSNDYDYFNSIIQSSNSSFFER